MSRAAVIRIPEPRTARVAVDGSSARMGRLGTVAGWAAVFETGEKYTSGAIGADNIDAEIMAAALAIASSVRGAPLEVISDSWHLVRAVHRRGFRRGHARAWESLDRAMGDHCARIWFSLVKAHNGHTLNEAADELARQARLTLAGGQDPSLAAVEWVPEPLPRGCLTTEVWHNLLWVNRMSGDPEGVPNRALGRIA